MALSKSNQVMLLKITSIFCILTILFLLSLIIFNQIQNGNRQKAIETEIVKQKDLLDGIVRSQNEYTTKKDLEKFIKDNNINLKTIKEDLSKVKGDVAAINVVLISSVGQKATNISSTSTGPRNLDPIPEYNCPDGTKCPNFDPFGYLIAQQDLLLNEDFGTLKVPIGSVGFSAWKDKPWTIDIRPKEYNISSVVGKDENQRSYFYNKVTVNVDGKPYELPIKSATTKEEYPEPKWSFWNPRLFVGIDGGVGINPLEGKFTPSLSLGVMSYGQYKNQPDFSVLQIGAGFDAVSKIPQVVVSPGAYNVGKHIPFMNNMYVGPSVHVGTDANFSIMMGIRVGL